MAYIREHHLEIEPVEPAGIWRPRSLHGAPAASAIGVGGRREWYRCRPAAGCCPPKQLHRAQLSASTLSRSASEPGALRMRRSETSSMSLAHLPQIARSGSRLGSFTSLQLDERFDPTVGDDLEDELETDILNGSQDQPTNGGELGGNSLDLSKEKRGSQVNHSPRTHWANALEAAMEEANLQTLFRLDLPLMVKAVADGEVTSLKEVAPPRWHELKMMAIDLQEELTRTGRARPGQRESLKVELRMFPNAQVVSELYDSLEEQGCNQGFDALCKSFTFLFGGLEEVQKVLDLNRNGTLSTTEFSMSMMLSGLDLGIICGLDEREIFMAVDVNHSGCINIEELLRFCSSKPAETKLSKADRAKKERERKAAAAKSSKKQVKMNNRDIIEQCGLKVVQEKEVQGVRFQAMVVPKPAAGTSAPATRTSEGMDLKLDELDQEEIDEMLEVLSKEEVLRAQAKWICVSRWLAAVLGASDLENQGKDRAMNWEDERQQAYDAVDQATLVPMAAGLPAVFANLQEPPSEEAQDEEDGSQTLIKKAGATLEQQLESFFQQEANKVEKGERLLDKPAARQFFDDLMLADFKWHQRLRMVLVDRLYDDTLSIQKEEDGFSKGLNFRSVKVVLYRMLRVHAETWMDAFRANIERQMNKRSKAPPRVNR